LILIFLSERKTCRYLYHQLSYNCSISAYDEGLYMQMTALQTLISMFNKKINSLKLFSLPGHLPYFSVCWLLRHTWMTVLFI